MSWDVDLEFMMSGGIDVQQVLEKVFVQSICTCMLWWCSRLLEFRGPTKEDVNDYRDPTATMFPEMANRYKSSSMWCTLPSDLPSTTSCRASRGGGIFCF